MNNEMTDLSFTQTSKAMSSKPLNRAKVGVKSVQQLANEQGKQEPVVRRVKKSDPSVFMGC
tara:strand:+ start:604 stop:786 length:183 start_codon:yes stop_codon:yes gene_type:complete